MNGQHLLGLPHFCGPPWTSGARRLLGLVLSTRLDAVPHLQSVQEAPLQRWLGFGKGFEDHSWTLNQSSDPHLLKCLPVHSQVMGLGRRLQLVCLFIYYLFINHKSRKDLRRLTIKDTNTVKLLKQNTPRKATPNGEGGT